jgi:hypothetical protein
MKLTRKKLRGLIEAFIASADGKLRRVGKDAEADYEHRLADKIMDKGIADLPANFKSKLSTLYDPNSDDLESKKQALELTAGLGAVSDDELETAKFDIDTAFGEEFDAIKDEEFNRGDIDLGLLKSFLNYLHKKGELVTTEKNKPYLTVYDVQEMFAKRYPGMGSYTDEFNFLNLGVEVYGDDFYIVGYDPMKFNI